MSTPATKASSAIRPFSIAVPDADLEDLRTRLKRTRYPRTSADAGWRYGTDKPFVERLVSHWLEKYDWRATEQRLNQFPQYIVNIDGYDIHFIHVRGSGTNPLPLILTHGWPGSFVEFDNVIEQLAHPEKFGGNIDDAFDVIVPSGGLNWSRQHTNLVEKMECVHETAASHLLLGGSASRNLGSVAGWRVDEFDRAPI